MNKHQNLNWNNLHKLTNDDLGIPNENKTKAYRTPVQKYIDNGYHLISNPRLTLSPPSVPVPVTEIQRNTREKCLMGLAISTDWLSMLM